MQFNIATRLLRGMNLSQAEVKRETRKVSLFYQYKIIIVMLDKCGVGKQEISQSFAYYSFCLSKVVKICNIIFIGYFV